MKKVLFILFSVVVLSGCSGSVSKNKSDENYKLVPTGHSVNQDIVDEVEDNQ